ncbi:HesB/IscA family protein [Roseococcus pinisoli]|uniref:Iron-sulfur cluster assembly accessory protein n=1 Tax=Roseococcus pinisoli TaxID=2835040 RepID=A0ABS5QEC4_9PROT|nr:iron-sulfur cluster assembly accessory protein [Roseococcus pinisoli]MBS7811828.1 iron-sulfur cluster assembly accessory protein [Roseococcus pinisoli]
MSITSAPSPRVKRELPPLMSVSDGAAERLRALYAKAEAGKLLHIGVKTKGCSGLAYDLSFVDTQAPGDERVTDKGVTILVDRKASLYLIGTMMDYEVRAMSAGFTFVNPNEKGRCGCGESFHV